MLCSKIIRRTFATAGNLLTWGQTTHGWARPTNYQYFTPGFVENFHDVVSVSTGQYHLGFLTKDNAVYTAGLDEDGRLGQSSNSDSELPRRVSFNDLSSRIASINCGSRHSLALTEDGAVYAWGYSGALGVETASEAGSPVRIPQQYFGNDRVVQVAAARDFSVALCDQGHLYIWGEGMKALPSEDDYNEVPRPWKEAHEFLHKRHAKVKKFAAVDTAFLMLLDNGRIYCYGKNNTGLFGARQNPLVMSDLQLSTFYKTYDALYKNQKIVDFEASAGSLIFRTETDRVFYNGMYDQYQPTPFPHNVRPKSIFATETSVGVVDQDNKLYFVNERIIEDSECLCPKRRLYECEDPNFKSEILAIGGTFNLRYALVK